MKLKTARIIFTINAMKLIRYINEQPDTQCTISYVVRSEREQKWLHEMKLGSKISKHTEGLAIDINLYINGVYQTTTEAHKKYGEYRKGLNNEDRWGGDFKNKDGNHYEYNPK